MFTTQTDKTLTCIECRQEFSFTASEQQFYADRQFSEPRRCPACRAARKASRAGYGWLHRYTSAYPARWAADVGTGLAFPARSV